MTIFNKLLVSEQIRFRAHGSRFEFNKQNLTKGAGNLKSPIIIKQDKLLVLAQTRLPTRSSQFDLINE